MAQELSELDDWRAEYPKKLVSAEEAAQVIQSGHNIMIPNEYLGKMPHAIVARKDELRDVSVEICTVFFDPGWLQPGMEGSFNIIVRCYLHNARVAHDEGRVPFIPVTNGTWLKTYRDNRPMARDIDVFMVVVSPPDEKGYCYFASGIWESRTFSSRAKIVIAEIDEFFTKSHNNAALHVSEIDYLVNITDDPLTAAEICTVADACDEDKQEAAKERLTGAYPRFFRELIPVISEVPPKDLQVVLGIDDPTDAMKAIAANLKSIMSDGDTIQIGTGKHTRHLVNLGVFDDCNDLSIFSEMACSGMGYLVKRGIATGKHASLHPGKAIFTSFLGMAIEEVRWACDNPLIELHPGNYVINIAHISQNRNMVSINNVVQVDLTGQITAESQFGPRLLNGAGGQIEFHIGAFMSEGGKAVSIMPSTWGDGAVSNITPYFEQGTLVTLSRYWADYVITEYGIAQLAGKSHRERAEELINIAHPNFRDELREAAKDIC